MNERSADSFDVLKQSSLRVGYAGKHRWNEGVWSGILRYGCSGRRMIYRHVAAFVVAAAHVAISRHLLAAFHF